jgi:HlyD family secretion protein
MYKLIKKLFSLLEPNQRKRFYRLQGLVVLMAIVEIVGVASIIPFMTLVGNMDLLHQDTMITSIYQASNIASKSQFVFIIGVGVLVMLFISAMISMVTTWRLSMFATQIGTEIADRLFIYYLKQNWLFHASGSSSKLTKKIANETTRVTSLVLLPLMQMNARIILVILMSTAIFAYDPKVAISGLILFVIAYLILYKVVRKRLQANGKFISETLELRFGLMSEGFGGIKDILLLNRAGSFIARFKQTGKTLAYSQGTNTALAQVPRYFMELIAFGSMIALVLYLIANHGNNLGMILPILSVYALAGFKLLPAFQQIYAGIAQIKGNISAFESIEEDLDLSSEILNQYSLQEEQSHPSINLETQITLENIKLTYPGKVEPILNELNILIPVNRVIGIVGPSGSGKSTLIDILLGLIQPDQGQLKIDKSIINNQNLRAWQSVIGLVPQNIFLSEGTVAENVAFGIPIEQIDIEQVNRALTLAHLDELIKSLEKGIYTKVGERGVQLSGGQRQRIGIARALYNEAKVLVFDEATSALDGITEKLIMEAIHDFSGKKTIIMVAHRLKTIQKCDQIFFVDKGQVIDQGTYLELIEKNSNFKEMAAHA